MADDRICNTCKACGNIYYIHPGASRDRMKFCPTCMDVRSAKLGIPDRLENKKVKKNMSRLAKINAAARAAGMSYGEYMGWLSQERVIDIKTYRTWTEEEVAQLGTQLII